MTSPITFNDIMAASTDKKGNITYNFDRAKAAKSLCDKLTLAMAEGNDRIWRFDGQIYQDNGKEYIKNLLYSIAGNDVEKREVNEVLDRITSKLQLSPVEFNPNPCLLGVKNGVLNCETGEFRSYSKQDLITDQLPVTYDQKAQCTEILNFIGSLTPDVDDRITLIDILASGAYRKALEYIAFLIGHGSSGSSTYIQLLQAFYGTKTTEAIPLNELVEKQFALSSLKDARFSVGQEMEEVKKAGTARIKEISGGDWISADVKNRDRARFRGWTKLIFKGNSVPRFTDNTWGFRRRFTEVKLLYKFVPVVDPDEPDQREVVPDIINKLTTASELSGLLNLIAKRLPWIIKNKRIHKKDGHYEAYKQQVDSVTNFLDTFCAYYPESKSIRIPIKDLRSNFTRWCSLTMANEVDAGQFGRYVKRYCENKPGIETTIDGKSAVVYPGLTFDKEKYGTVITDLQQSLKTGVDRSSTGVNTGVQSSQQLLKTGVTGVESVENSSSSELWNEIITLYTQRSEKCKNTPVSPVFDKQWPHDTPVSTPVKLAISPVVEEFLKDGGQSSLERFLAEFPEART